MSEQVPMQLIVAAFQDINGAEEVWKELKSAKWGGLIKIDRMAIIQRTEKDKLKIKEQGDPGGGKGAAWGAVVGGIIGSIAGPIGAVVVGGATGAVVGGITAKYYDSGIPDSRLKEIGAALKPGTSAIVALIEHKWVAELEKELQEEGADVLTHALAEDISQQLADGKDVAFTAISDEDSVEMAHVAGNEDEVEAQHMVITDEGVAVEAVEANQEGAAYAAAVSDGENVAAVSATATLEEGEGDDKTSDASGGTGEDDDDNQTQGAGVITSGDA